MSDLHTPADPTQHPAMRRFAAAVRALYGDRVERIVLFGSRARGDAREDSDWDVAIFLRGMGDWRKEAEPLGAIGAGLTDETGAVITAQPFRAGRQPCRPHAIDGRDQARRARSVMARPEDYIAKRVDRSFTTFLASGCRLKERDDHIVEPGTLISRGEARGALATAARLVAHAESLLSPP